MAKSSPNRAQRLRFLGASVGVAGVMAGIFGSVLTAVSWFCHGDARFYFRLGGALLLFAVLPLLIVGTYCFESAEKKMREDRKETK
ncbi:MAG: hypothetical protein C4334_14040 [Pyrinomonas sp.]|uniref:hypothetical protein n=1 Tax=Pyrinomonas sp. TaxID=2080306 RepID=UPI0033313D6A